MRREQREKRVVDDLLRWREQDIVRPRQDAEPDHAQMTVDEADMADQRDPFVAEQPDGKVRVEARAARRDPRDQLRRNRPFSRQRILLIEGGLVAAKRFRVATLVIEVLAELNQVV